MTRTEELPAPDRRTAAESGAMRFAAVSSSLLPVLILLRVYEYFAVSATHVLPRGAVAILAAGTRSDLALTLWLSALLCVPVIALAHWWPRFASKFHRATLVIVVIADVMLIQYFAVTFVPLGADVFGYTLSYVRFVVRTSGGVGWLSLLPPLLAGILIWVGSGCAALARIGRTALVAFFIVTAAAVIFHSPLSIKPEEFRSEPEYFLAQNKIVFFTGSAVGYLTSRWSPAPATKLSGFPLLRRATYHDVLGPYFKVGAQRPNLVFIVVEGLGRDFVGDGARYGGFTPFLDSLTRRSLYWENFVSTTGRTFGLLPALLGSLPFGDNGFMDLKSRMPRHLSIPILLKKGGYSIDFFSGTNGQFEFIDGFMEHEGVDRFIDESSFGSGYVRQPASPGGESWGYPDAEMFRRSFATITPPGPAPRMDIYQTITTHEPFIPPRTAEYEARFSRTLAALAPQADRRAEYVKYSGIFSTLLYTDDAIRYFLTEYAKREEFSRTIFFITGDHRLIPIPPHSRIDRFHVPFLIFSPMLKAPHRFSSVSSQLDVAPTVIAFMHHNYGMEFPDSVSWLGSGIDTATRFRNVHSIALMRNKNELDSYLDGTNFLSGDQLFRLDDRFALTAVNDQSARDRVRAKLDAFRNLDRFLTTGEHLLPSTIGRPAQPPRNPAEDSIIVALGLEHKTPTEVFDFARKEAIAGRYENARLILQKLLRDTPSYYDARALLGRTYSWDRKFEEGRPILEDLVRRAPGYIDGHLALLDLEIFAGNGERALSLSDSALARFPGNGDLLVGKARALELLGRRKEAVVILDSVAPAAARKPAATALRARLSK